MWKKLRLKSKKTECLSIDQGTKTPNTSTSESSPGSVDQEQSQSLKSIEVLEKELGDIIVSIIRRASERPPIWWQWLMLFVFGTLAGLGLGVLISYLLMPRTIVVPPINVTLG